MPFMRKIRQLAAATATLLFFLPVAVTAGYITLDIQTSVNKRAENVELLIHVRNSGDETARNVTPEAWIQDETFEFNPKNIDPDKIVMFQSNKRLEILRKMKKGTYPVYVLVKYTDSDQVDHYGPAYGILKTTNLEPVVPLDVQIEPLVMKSKGKLTVSVSSDTSTALTLFSTLYTTPQLETDPVSLQFELKPHSSKNFSFELVNKGLPDGSVVPVSLVLEMGTPSSHATKIFQTPVSIVMNESAFLENTAEGVDRGYFFFEAIIISVALLFLGLIITWLVYRKNWLTKRM